MLTYERFCGSFLDLVQRIFDIFFTGVGAKDASIIDTSFAPTPVKKKYHKLFVLGPKNFQKIAQMST